MWGWRGKAGGWVVMILSQQCSQKLLIMCYVLLPQSRPYGTTMRGFKLQQLAVMRQIWGEIQRGLGALRSREQDTLWGDCSGIEAATMWHIRSTIPGK